jgi:hypothetical protein
VNIVGGIDANASRQAIGRFRVSTATARVQAFRDAIALAGSPELGVPMTFPLTWWMEPEIKGALVAAMAADPFRRDAALVHLDQTLDYHRPLIEGASYWLDVMLVGPTADERFRVEAAVVDDTGAEVAALAGGFVRTRQEPA